MDEDVHYSHQLQAIDVKTRLRLRVDDAGKRGAPSTQARQLG